MKRSNRVLDTQVINFTDAMFLSIIRLYGGEIGLKHPVIRILRAFLASGLTVKQACDRLMEKK